MMRKTKEGENNFSNYECILVKVACLENVRKGELWSRQDIQEVQSISSG